MNTDVEILRVDLEKEDLQLTIKKLGTAFAALNPPKYLVATTAMGTQMILFYDYNHCPGCKGTV